MKVIILKQTVANVHTLRYDKPELVNFSWICPASSKTLAKQKAKNDSGLTIIANVENTEKFIEVIGRIKNIRESFRDVKNLHVTLLQIFESGQLPPEYHIQEVSKSVKHYLHANRIKQLNIKFTLIRPGTHYSQITGRPLYGTSDGTVVAFADDDDDTLKFSSAGDGLAGFLKKKFPDLFGEKLTRKYPTVWSTLGYFDEKDFEITSELYNLFDDYQLRHFSSEECITKFEIVKFGIKSLEDKEVVGEIEL